MKLCWSTWIGYLYHFSIVWIVNEIHLKIARKYCVLCKAMILGGLNSLVFRLTCFHVSINIFIYRSLHWLYIHNVNGLFLTIQFALRLRIYIENLGGITQSWPQHNYRLLCRKMGLFIQLQNYIWSIENNCNKIHKTKGRYVRRKKSP